MPKIDIKIVRQRKGSSYPAPFHEKAGDRVKQPLGDAGGLTDFGVNLTFLPPDPRDQSLPGQCNTFITLV